MVFIYFQLLRYIKEIPDGYKATAPFMPVLIASAKERPGKVDMQTENYATVRLSFHIFQSVMRKP